MSSYLSIYGVLPKKDEKKETRALLRIYSRNSKMYDLFDRCCVCYYGDTWNETVITEKYINSVIIECDIDIKELEDKINVYKENSHGNMEVLDTIVELQKELAEYYKVHTELEFIKQMVADLDYGTGQYEDFTYFEKIVCNVD